jgi:hypothetical protein
MKNHWLDLKNAPEEWELTIQFGLDDPCVVPGLNCAKGDQITFVFPAAPNSYIIFTDQKTQKTFKIGMRKKE